MESPLNDIETVVEQKEGLYSPETQVGNRFLELMSEDTNLDTYEQNGKLKQVDSVEDYLVASTQQRLRASKKLVMEIRESTT